MTRITSSHTVQKALGTALAAACLSFTASLCGAQVGPVPRQMQSFPAPTALSSISLQTNGNATTSCELKDEKDKKDQNTDFGAVALGRVGIQECDVQVAAGNPIVSIVILDGSKLSTAFKSVTTKLKAKGKAKDAAKAGDTTKNQDKDQDPCNPTVPLEGNATGTCKIWVGFAPFDDHSSSSATLTVMFWDGTQQAVKLTGKGATAAPCSPAKYTLLPLSQGFNAGRIYPFAPKGMEPELEISLYSALGDPIRKSVVNCFYNTNGLFTYFNQFQSTYNAASGSTTLNANLGTLNFVNGMQLTVGTNPQVGASNSNATTPASSTPAAIVPTLSSTAAAQAAQNVQNGGTVFGFNLFPLIARQSNPLFYLSTVLREGVDLQKFNNTSITSTNPSTHTFVGLQSYLQYSSSNNTSNSSDPAGSIFLGANYGYNLMNHTYSLQNGFGGRVNTQIAQVSAGILFNGGVKIAAYRGFGPSQRYMDSTSMTQKTVNNFQTWSIAIAYQSSGAGKTK